MLLMVKMAVGGWSVLPRAALPARRWHLDTAGSECEAQEAGWSQLELLLSLAWQFPCVRMPAWSLGGIPDRCMHGALALLQLRVIAVTSAETLCVERDPSPVFIPFFLLVPNFCLVYQAHFWLPYTCACWKTL